jgi:hypothetical protein
MTVTAVAPPRGGNELKCPYQAAAAAPIHRVRVATAQELESLL